MELSEREQRIRAGEMGEAARIAIEQQIAVGEFFGAERFVPVSSVHMMGDMEVMGDAGFAFIQDLVDKGARFTVPVTTNARCVDFERAAAIRDRIREIEARLQGKDVKVATIPGKQARSAAVAARKASA